MSTYDPAMSGIDLKRIWKQLLSRLWLVVTAVLLGALAGFLAYTMYSRIKSGNTVYRIRNDYYITLNYEGYPNGPDYYNAYTWDGILRDDPIVDYALTLIPEVSKEQILASVTGEILGDYRLLTVVVKGTDRDLVQGISDAYKQALPHFADEIDMISHIDLWTDADIEEYDEYTRDLNAALLGAVIGLLLSVFGLLIYYITDDGIYSERDWVSRYPDIPYLGKRDSVEAEVNTEYIIGDMEGIRYLDVSGFEFSRSLFEELRASKGVILAVAEGKDKGNVIDKVVYTLMKQDVKIKGTVIS